MPILSFSAIALIWFQGSLREIENKCAAFDAPLHGYFSLFMFSFQLLLLFFCVSSSWLIPQRWKLAFLIPPEATRPLQNTHFPINKYTKTFSHLSQSQTQYTNKHNNHRNSLSSLSRDSSRLCVSGRITL